MQPQTLNKVPVLVVRCKSFDKSNSNYNRYESLLIPGHWNPISHRDIESALELGIHVLWNPITMNRIEAQNGKV